MLKPKKSNFDKTQILKKKKTIKKNQIVTTLKKSDLQNSKTQTVG